MDVGDSKSGLCGLLFNLIKSLVNLQTGEISLESTYEPDKMSDFDANLRFNGAWLVQQPLFDHDGQLVPPGKAPFVFKKGALVAIEAHLSVYHFMADEKPNHVRASPCVSC